VRICALRMGDVSLCKLGKTEKRIIRLLVFVISHGLVDYYRVSSVGLSRLQFRAPSCEGWPLATGTYMAAACACSHLNSVLLAKC
jgi:hypothetical protein